MAAQQTVRTVVAQAERMARARLTSVHLAVGCGQPGSTTFSGHVEVADGIVQKRDVAALASGAEAFARRDGRVLLALNRIGYRLDGLAATRPLGLAGHRLEADHHAVTVDDGPLRNLSLLVESCHLQIAGLVPAGYASALSTTTEEERRGGVICLDIGAGVTSIAVFADGHFVFADQIPTGGQHLTLEIARELGIPLAEAERIKALYGTLVSTASDEHDLVTYTVPDGDRGGQQQTTKAALGRILRLRMQGLVQQVAARIAASSIGRLPMVRVVLSGGGSRMLGLGDFVATQIIAGGRGIAVRVAGPALLHGVVDEQSSPAFACLVGVLLAAQASPATMRLRSPGQVPERQGYMGRMERWLQESF